MRFPRSALEQELGPASTQRCGSVVIVQLLSCIWLFATLWTAACQASLSFTISWSLLKFKSTESVMLSNHLCPQSYPSLFYFQSFPTSGSFPMSQLFTTGGQSIEASTLASDLSMNIQHCSSLGLIGLISLQSKGLSQESSPAPLFKSINSSALSVLHSPTLTSIHDHRKNHSLDWTLVGKVMSLLFNILLGWS